MTEQLTLLYNRRNYGSMACYVYVCNKGEFLSLIIDPFLEAYNFYFSVVAKYVNCAIFFWRFISIRCDFILHSVQPKINFVAV